MMIDGAVRTNYINCPDSFLYLYERSVNDEENRKN